MHFLVDLKRYYSAQSKLESEMGHWQCPHDIIIQGVRCTELRKCPDGTTDLMLGAQSVRIPTHTYQNFGPKKCMDWLRHQPKFQNFDRMATHTSWWVFRGPTEPLWGPAAGILTPGNLHRLLVHSVFDIQYWILTINYYICNEKRPANIYRRMRMHRVYQGAVWRIL